DNNVLTNDMLRRTDVNILTGFGVYFGYNLLLELRLHLGTTRLFKADNPLTENAGTGVQQGVQLMIGYHLN
ncbi:MAG: hypothetical protein AAFO94_08460, partial [Bacteroidota bacterium]